MFDIKKTIFRKIKEYDTIVIARHIGPDPDAICSEIALRDSIRLRFPNKKVYAIGKSVSRFKKFGDLDKVDVKTLKNALLITLDLPNLSRIDGITDLSYKEIIKIDHHPFEENFGGIEWIDDTACSTCQMIAELLFKNNFKLDRNIGSNLFLGIVSDSDRFLLYYTSVKTFKIVTMIIERCDLPFTSLYQKLYERPLNEINFYGHLATNFTLTDNGLLYEFIKKEDILKYNVDNATPSNMINDFNYIQGVNVWLFITYDENLDLYKVNIRSKGPIINEIATRYNGGGHQYAAGVRTSSKDDITNLLKDLDEACKKWNEKK